jgi:hypothetical protein
MAAQASVRRHLQMSVPVQLRIFGFGFVLWIVIYLDWEAIILYI